MNVIDLFAGGGGASEGIRQALGVCPTLAVNHDQAAIDMHALNHPRTKHLREDLGAIDPINPRPRTPVDLLWASPDCCHFSRAKGAQPRKTGKRTLAWVVLEWARTVHPRVVVLENVPEFEQWGPLDDEGRRIKERAGRDFRAFVEQLRIAGYRVQWRVLSAADYGAPTTRRRLFLIARCDGQPIVWPEPTHGPGRAKPYRTAAECIDWSIPCPSIFGRKRPLADATLRRIGEGIRRFVVEAPRPFLVCLTHGGRLEALDEPMRTITAAHRGERALVAPTLIQAGYGERKGQRPRTLDLHAPLGTVVAGGPKHALVAAFLAKHYGGVVGHGLGRPLGTVTTVDHHSLVAAFLSRYNGRSVGQSPAEPLGTIDATDRFGLVTVDLDGEPYAIVDIGLRMLQPRELARAQGFGDAYQLIGTKREQVARIGNSVSPPVARAVVAANLGPRGPQLAEVA